MADDENKTTPESGCSISETKAERRLIELAIDWHETRFASVPLKMTAQRELVRAIERVQSEREVITNGQSMSAPIRPTDLCERLRRGVALDGGRRNYTKLGIMDDAADEIERLRLVIVRLEEDLAFARKALPPCD